MRVVQISTSGVSATLTSGVWLFDFLLLPLNGDETHPWKAGLTARWSRLEDMRCNKDQQILQSIVAAFSFE
jgi:hypothetical protein